MKRLACVLALCVIAGNVFGKGEKPASGGASTGVSTGVVTRRPGPITPPGRPWGVAPRAGAQDIRAKSRLRDPETIERYRGGRPPP